MAPFNAKLLFILHFVCFTLSTPQHPEINDQFTNATTDDTKGEAEDVPINDLSNISYTTTTKKEKYEYQKNRKEEEHRTYFTQNEVTDVEAKPSLIETIYEVLTRPISIFLTSPKVSFVLRNIGTCVVNGAMEIVAHYFPAPFIPLIASAAGMVIPFEPVVMLKEKMPVTSYRRAFGKAMNSFLNTFDAYKLDNFDDDPYMTRRFNRRFMNDASGEKKGKSNNDG